MNDHNRATISEPSSGWLANFAPTAAVLLVLGGIALAGHFTGWSLPKFDQLLGNHDEDDDWCKEHGVPESICVECDAKLLPHIKLTWCPVHGVHNCPFERPDVAQLKTTPTIAREDLERAQRALALKERPENNALCKQALRRIQFASVEALDKMKVNYYHTVQRGAIEETVSASGEIMFEKPRVAPASISIAGRVKFLTAKGRIGAQVSAGDVLALVDAIEVGKAKAELLQAFAQWELRKVTVDRLKPVYERGGVSDVRMLEVESALREADIRLMGAEQALSNLGLSFPVAKHKGLTAEELYRRIQFHGIPADIVKEMPKTDSANLFPVLAPCDGAVSSANVTVGDMADPTKTLFVVADTRQMWLMLNVRNEDVKYLRVRDPKTGAPGQKVRFRPDASDHEVTGELVWKSTEVDEKTRTVQFRAVLPNSNGTLLANTFGTGRVILREEKDAIVVPPDAIHWEGDCHIVFVRDKNFLAKDGLKVFHVRTVRPGVTDGKHTEIIAGLLPGEIIATTNSAILRGELLKNTMGAGCGCH